MNLMGTHEQVPHRGSGQIFVGSIHFRQQGDIPRRIDSREVRSLRRLPPNLAAISPSLDQPGHLSTAQSGYLHQKPTNQSSGLPSQFAVALVVEYAFDELVCLR